MYICHIMRD